MAKLGDICTLVNGYAFKPSDWKSEGLPIIRIQNLNDTSATFNYFDGEIDEKYLVNNGDLLFSWSGTPGTSFGAFFWERGKGVLNQHIFNVHPISDVSKEYLRYALNGNINKIIDKAHGGVGLQHITKNELVKIEIPILSSVEQQAIVIVLDNADRLISLRKQQLEKLDELVKSRFVELFGDQELNPFGWVQCTLGECCTLKSGTSLPAEVENEGGSIPYVKVGDMNYPGNERYITTSSRYVSEETAGNGLFGVGSIIFPKRGEAIGTNKKRMTKLPICADLNVMGVSSNGKLLPEYLFAYFDLIDLGTLSDGSSVPQINNKNIAPLVICLPPMELQKQFAAFVEQTDKSKLAVQQSLDKLETLKKALMQKYFG